ncbi:MAG: hypothetical protein HOJ56_14230 [Acidimicrobiaceae bacterium]|nr:hypothetical protein [Acidimicrobiaceae bacterium]
MSENEARESNPPGRSNLEIALVGLVAVLIALLSAVLLVQCSGDSGSEDVDSTQGQGDATADTAVETSTTVAETSTTVAETSTTVAEATTTVVEATTTTTVPPPPATGVITTIIGVAGWSSAGEWMTTDDGPVPLSEGDVFTLVHVGEPLTQVVGGEVGVWCDGPGIGNSGIDLDFGTEWPDDFPIAVSADWDLIPHTVEVLPNDNATYKAAASELLGFRGVIDPDPPLVQVIRADLEGDGVDEIIVVAERNTSGSLNPANPGDYSIAFMRKLIEGEVQSAILGSSVVEEPPDESWIVALDTYRIAAVADLNGDGRMEIAVNGRYYEGSWTTIYEYINDDLGTWEVLSVGCGS